MRYYFTSTRMTKLKKTANKCWQGWGKLNFHALLVIMCKIANLGNSLAVPQKVKHRVTIWPSNYTSNCIPWRTETYVHTKTRTWMFIAVLSIIPKKVESTQMSSSQWMNKQNLCTHIHTRACVHTHKHTHTGILLSSKKEWGSDTCCDMGEPWKRDAWVKSPKVTY